MPEHVTIDKRARCTSCNANIFLVRFGQHYKWVTNPAKRDTWHCNTATYPTREWPVRTHQPDRP